MLRPPPAFRGAVVPKRIAAYQKQLSRHERANAAIAEQQFLRKLPLLFDHYGIADKEDMAALARKLALEHVPGFKVQFPEAKSGGRKRKWYPDRLEALRRTVQSLKDEHHFTDRQALTFMVNDQKKYAETWGVPAAHKGSKEQWIETLESRLQEAKGLQKCVDQAKRKLQTIKLQTIAASMKFRK
jgi:hypothetical protein